jgi:FkbM family methyltransferase
MNLQVIHEHTVDLDLLPEKAKILDLGSLGLDFTRHFRSLGHLVHAVDIQNIGGESWVMGISDFDGAGSLVRHGDKQATTLRRDDERGTIPVGTLKSFMEMVNVPFFDLIKIDVEGSEREIILSLTKAPATQLSIEFHLHTGVYSQPDVALMVAKLRSLGYKSVQHVFERRHGLCENYWDSLFIFGSPDIKDYNYNPPKYK